MWIAEGERDAHWLLLPAIQVAWADGVIQPAERQRIVAAVEASGLARDSDAMDRITRWLAAPPSDDDVREALAELRSGGVPEARAERALEHARSVASAHGGLFGVGAISSDEKRVLSSLETALQATPRRSTRAGALGVMRDLLSERLASDTAHVDLVPREVSAMWPRPSPLAPDRMPPAVFGIPESEHREFLDNIIARYVRTLATGGWDAVMLAVDRPGVAPMDDGELARLILETPFSRFLVATLDADDEARFAKVLATRTPAGTLYKVDQSHLGSWEPLPGMFVAGAVGLFALDRRADREVLTPLAIAVGGHVFGPDDGESWARARYFLLQGCSITMVTGIHPFLHFPMDSVIGATRETFPETHPIRRLIEAHAYMHLPIDHGVRWNARSVAHNHQHEIYTPFPARHRDVFRGIGDCYTGIEGNSAYPGFRYPMSAPAIVGAYGRFLSAYYDVVLAFTDHVAAAVAPDDPFVACWASTLHEALPGFPGPTRLRDAGVLARVLAGFVHAVSIWHSAEHHAYAIEPVQRVPQRLRVPPPTGDDPTTDPRDWLTGTDIARQEMARRMFYEVHTLRSILDVRYGFEEPALERAARAFTEALRACDRERPERYIEIERVACSIQF